MTDERFPPTPPCTRRMLLQTLGRATTASLALAAAGRAGVAAAGPASDAAALMAQADRANRARFERFTVRMELTGPDGKPMARELQWHALDEGGTRSVLFKFTEPASLRGVATLVVETPGKPNAIWHYQPATRNVRRVSGEHRQNRFMGTEFVFEDFEGLKLERYAFSVLRSEACGEGAQCHVIDGQPSDDEERRTSSYSRKVYWVDQKVHVIRRIELFDLAGAKAKTFESTGFQSTGGHWRPRRQVMTHHASGRTTTLVELKRSVDEPFERYFVSQQYLRAE